ERSPIVGARDIGLDRRCSTPCVGDVARGSLSARRVDVDYRDISAQTRELESNCAADALPGAGDNRHLISEIQHSPPTRQPPYTPTAGKGVGFGQPPPPSVRLPS